MNICSNNKVDREFEYTPLHSKVEFVERNFIVNIRLI